MMDHRFVRDVVAWGTKCHGEAPMACKRERNHRFIEEAIELVQACGCSRDEVLMLVDYVFGRPVGTVEQELGGVAISLALLVAAHGEDFEYCAEQELSSVWARLEAIRAKSAKKPRDPGALPLR